MPYESPSDRFYYGLDPPRIKPVNVIFYDVTAGGLSLAWGTGGWLLKAFKGFKVVPVSSWHDVYAWLWKRAAKSIDSIQFWMHGYTGSPLINGAEPDIVALSRALAHVMRAARSWVWFRACCVFQGPRGLRFAAELADRVGCRIFGHTRIVSWPIFLCQSGGYGLRKDETPHWDKEDGVTPDGRQMGSSWLAPNTCSTFRLTPPEEWLQESAA